VYATRQSGGELQVLDYRDALPDTGASTVARIGPGPAEAVRMLRERLASPARATPTASAPQPAPVAAAAS
jgi:MerR family transcriptional regulator, light-induced transcriptional regulator